MNFDNPAWRSAPVSTGLRIAKSLIRRAVPGLRNVVVPYDGGRSRILADLQTPLGLELYRYGRRDPDLELVGRLLSPGDLFVDGGAHVGLFTLIAAERVGRSGRVVSFEPTPAIRARLLANIELNGLVQVDVVPSALSSEIGTAAFRVFDLVGSGLNHLSPIDGEHGGLETVTVTTLDAALAERDCRRLRLIKLDLEGAELAALRGATATLARLRPDLLIEVEPHHLARMGASAPAVEALLREHGYRFFRTGEDAAGAPTLTAIGSVSEAAPQPNVFATTNPERLRASGLTLR